MHLAIAAGGGVLLYAALRGVSPVQALKDITSGAPPAVSTSGKTLTARGDLDPDYVPGGYGSTPWKGVYRKNKVPKSFQRPVTFLAAAQTHASETYSQDARWAKGHSDCASFVGKSLLDIGVEPPGGSTTGDYLQSGQWVKVSTPRMGDIAVNGKHMVICLDGTNGIGQQNSRRNVQRDTLDNLMANTGGYELRRYRGWA
ncbi:MAG: hypothetical protein HOV73_01855 [Streptomyces sp.]|nr:hypothetical protein [Streptomyces sp.]